MSFNESNEAMLRRALIRLLARKPFFAHLLQSMKHVYTEDVPTTGVSLTLTTNLFINPSWFKKLSKDQQVAVLEHEVYHLIHQHIPRCTSGKFDKHLYNMAADIAINQHIENLPEGCLLPATFAFPSNETTEFYYKKLKEYPKLKIGMVNTLDDHNLWEKSKQYSDMLEERLKELVKEAMEKGGLTASDVSKDLERDFRWILEAPFNWKNLLNNYLQKASLKKYTRTKMRPSRRYGIKYPGIRANYELILGVCIDLSGSITREAQEKFYGWLDEIKRTTNYKVLVAEFDTDVKRLYEFTSREDVLVPKGGGGTSFIPPFKRMSEENVDVILMFTDGENGNEKIDFPSQDILWVLFQENQTINYDIGQIVYITD